MKDLSDKVKAIIESNIYMTLATAGEHPWAAPVFYCTDYDYNFYFISQPDSRHIQHIQDSSMVAFAIFDSSAKEGTGTGVQGAGRVELLETKEEIEGGLKHYFTSFVDCSVENFSGDKPYRLYKLIPDTFYTQDPNAQVDKRVEVKLQ